MTIQIIPVQISKDVQEHDNIVDLILSSSSKPEIQDKDIVVILMDSCKSSRSSLGDYKNESS